MSSKVATIQTSKGDVHTGKVVSTDDHFGRDMAAAALFPVILAAPASPPTVTVENNGQKYSGRKI